MEVFPDERSTNVEEILTPPLFSQARTHVRRQSDRRSEWRPSR